jgi:hypothetical protein
MALATTMDLDHLFQLSEELGSAQILRQRTSLRRASGDLYWRAVQDEMGLIGKGGELRLLDQVSVVKFFRRVSLRYSTIRPNRAFHPI